MQAEVGSGRFAVVPRDDAAEALLPFDLTFGCWRKVQSQILGTENGSQRHPARLP